MKYSLGSCAEIVLAFCRGVTAGRSARARFFSFFLLISSLLCGCSEYSDRKIQDPQGVKPLTKSEPPWYAEYGFGAYWRDTSSAEGRGLPGTAELRRLQQRGDYLVKGLAACGVCHGQDYDNPSSPLSGGRRVEDRFGSVLAANITPDRTTGIGDWSLSQIVRALRASIGKNGEALSLDSHQQYRWMANRDAEAIAAYLLSAKPIRNEVSRRELSEFQRRKWGILSQHDEVLGYVPTLSEKAVPQYGMYLTSHVAGCRTCHTPSGEMFDNPLSFAGREGKRRSLFGALKQLGGFLAKDDLVSQEEQKRISGLLSPEGQEIYGVGNNPERSRIIDAEQIHAESFPVVGPDIRGSSEKGLAGWSTEDIVNYLDSGRTPEGKSADPEFCPWTYYSTASLNDKRAIALYLKNR